MCVCVCVLATRVTTSVNLNTLLVLARPLPAARFHTSHLCTVHNLSFGNGSKKKVKEIHTVAKHGKKTERG